MPASGASLSKVEDLVSRMRSLRQLYQQAKLALAENEDAVLTTAERDTIRARLMATYDMLGDQVRAETSGW